MKTILIILSTLLIGTFASAQATSLHIRNNSSCPISLTIYMVPVSCVNSSAINSSPITILASSSVTYTNATGSLPPGITTTGNYFLYAKVANSTNATCVTNSVMVGESCLFSQSDIVVSQELVSGQCVTCDEVHVEWTDEDSNGQAVLSLFP